ncbi:uncharacterized protein LOC124942530 isoform X2 [Impatiens glandulifera]|uniref:uncharacterized protein LOC124942530 isoform X2 n=1 Tax=Impatiens glandulifera TaxID=253017 RepID=UPI001FB09AF7|nr:uncharacterized protein LOC124942530 isoform X2 [Impatiens glandulifera]XP_047339011.1 uncharacterized protein LOC124942530 isoform X2 [Impatiens glandulifera]
MVDLFINGVRNNVSNKNSLRCNYALSTQPGYGSSIDDIFTRFLALTSYISRQFLSFIEDLVDRDVNRRSEDVVVVDSGSGEDSSSFNSPLVHECCCSPSSSSSRYSFCSTRLEFVQRNCNSWGVPFVFQGLVIPFFTIKLAWKMASASWRYSVSYVVYAQTRAQRIVSRIRTTLHGSSDDIGWLQHTPGLAPVEDGSTRFMELLQCVRTNDHKLPNTFVYLLIPGLFSNHSPLYFVSTKRFFSKMGLACHIARIHSEASVEQNAWELKQYIEELYWGSGKHVMLLGHSKGGVDAAASLSLYWDDLKDKVAGLALVQSPYGGTPIASDILREGQIADKETRTIMEFFICKVIKGDIRALEDLTYERRREFIMNHKLPLDIPIISFNSEASIAPGVLASLSHIAQAELPFPKLGNQEGVIIQRGGHKVPVIVPISAVLAVFALHLKLRYGEKSDGLVTCCDAEVPGSVVVRPNQKLDHAWMVYSSWRKDPEMADASCEMCEALFTMLVELGKGKQKRIN